MKPESSPDRQNPCRARVALSRLCHHVARILRNDVFMRLNAVALWNTRYLSAAVDQLRTQSVPQSRMRTSPASAPSATPTSTSLVATPSPPPHPPKAFGSSAKSPDLSGTAS